MASPVSFENSAALTSLEEGCVNLALPQGLALELLKFLALKKRTTKAISPSSRMDELWHWALLNTRVINEVYQCLGGPVEHSTEEGEFSAFDHALRRLRALNLLEREGQNPTVAFWVEQNGCPFLTHLREVPTVPTSRFFMAFGEESDVMRFVDVLGPEFGVQVVVNQLLIGGPTRNAIPAGDQTMVSLTINDLIRKYVIRISLTDTVYDLKCRISEIEGIHFDQQRLIFCGKQLEDDKCLHECNIQAESMLHLIKRMRGC